LKQQQLVRQQTKFLEQRKKQAAKQVSTTTAAPVGGGAIMDPAAAAEWQELQQQLVATKRDYFVVQQNMDFVQKGRKMNELTRTELEKLAEQDSTSGKLYRSIGKIFYQSDYDGIMEHLATSMQQGQVKEEQCQQKLEYLERRIKSQQQNIEELTRNARATVAE
jgi:chaperonin cofactor prefoldin